MAPQLVLTVDVGTTAIKLVLYHNTKQIHAHQLRIQTYTEGTGKAYQRPEELLRLLHQGVVLMSLHAPAPIQCIALSTAMHALLPLYEEGPGEVLIWSDSQAAQTAAAFRNEPLSHTFYEKTGTPIHYMSPFAKLLWLKETGSPQKKVLKWLGLKELICHYLTDDYSVDYSTASATGLFNSLTMEWDQDIMRYLGIGKEQLPNLVDTNTQLPISSEKKEMLRLSKDATLLIGASDGCLAAFAGYLATGLTSSLTLGTSGAVRTLAHHRELDPSGKTFCYYLAKDLWVIGGPTNNGGLVLEWLSRLFFGQPAELFQHLDQALTLSPPGAKGLSFLPYINGERAPHWNANFTGSFLGITTAHQRSDFIRAAIEGVFFNLKSIMCVHPVGEPHLSINGGIFKHPALGQLAATILEKDCLLSPHNEPGFGLLGLLDMQTHSAAKDALQHFQQDPEATSMYDAAYARFLYLAEEYAAQRQ